MENKLKGHFYIIVGPSGVGKNTLISSLMKNMQGKINFPVSATTRPKREGERDGINYYFYSKEEFRNKIENGEFIEWAEVFGNYYGTLKDTILTSLKEGKLLIKDIDVQGALELKEKLPKNNVTTIFILPPSINELENRIRDRGLDSEDAIKIRINDAHQELSQKDKFDVKIINEDLEKATKEFIKIIENEIQ